MRSSWSVDCLSLPYADKVAPIHQISRARSSRITSPSEFSSESSGNRDKNVAKFLIIIVKFVGCPRPGPSSSNPGVSQPVGCREPLILPEIPPWLCSCNSWQFGKRRTDYFNLVAQFVCNYALVLRMCPKMVPRKSSRFVFIIEHYSRLTCPQKPAPICVEHYTCGELCDCNEMLHAVMVV